MYAATAWHWIDPGIRYQRAWQALRPGGYLLLGPTDAPLDAAPYEICWGEGAVAYRRKSGDA